MDKITPFNKQDPELWKQQNKEGMPFDSAYTKISFRYFIEKTAPISKEKSLMCYNCRFIASMNIISKSMKGIANFYLRLLLLALVLMRLYLI